MAVGQAGGAQRDQDHRREQGQDDEAADEAIKQFDGYSLSNRQMVVNVARPREDRPAGGRSGGYDGGNSGGGGRGRY